MRRKKIIAFLIIFFLFSMVLYAEIEINKNNISKPNWIKEDYRKTIPNHKYNDMINSESIRIEGNRQNVYIYVEVDSIFGWKSLIKKLTGNRKELLL